MGFDLKHRGEKRENETLLNQTNSKRIRNEEHNRV